MTGIIESLAREREVKQQQVAEYFLKGESLRDIETRFGWRRATAEALLRQVLGRLTQLATEKTAV